MKCHILKVSYDACAAAEVQKIKDLLRKQNGLHPALKLLFLLSTSVQFMGVRVWGLKKHVANTEDFVRVCLCVASPLGSAGRCSSQTVGTQGRIKFGSCCDSSHTGTQEPRIQSFLFYSLSFFVLSLSLSLCSCLSRFNYEHVESSSISVPLSLPRVNTLQSDVLITRIVILLIRSVFER